MNQSSNPLPPDPADQATEIRPLRSPGGPYKPGQEFGPYVLDEYLGAGGFKSVYRAHRNVSDPVIPDVVALGFPHHQDEVGIEEVTKEFSVLSQIKHPHIMRVFTVEHQDDVAFLVMEFVEGRTLRDMLTEAKRLEEDKALRYIGMVCEALVCAHSAHILHRDVKPENIFLTSDHSVRLLDFGVARLLARTSQKASSGVGTMSYMAPEQMQGAAGINADLWALGITFYELLVGERPFTGETGELFRKVTDANERYDERPLHERQIDTRIIRVIRKLLQKDPESRYQTAEDLLRDLEAVARKTRLVDDDEGRLEVLIRAGNPLVAVVSFEEDRVLAAVRQIIKRLAEDRRPRQFYIWSASLGLRDEQNQLISQDTLSDPTAALLHAIENPEDAVYVFLDLHRHYSPVITRLIRDAARVMRASRKTALFLSPFYDVPEELRTEVTWASFQLPDRPQLGDVLTGVVEEVRQAGGRTDLPTAAHDRLVRAASGLTANESQLAFRLAAVRNAGLDMAAARHVVDSKTQVIRKSGILDYYDRPESFSAVGGLEQLRAWFNGRRPAFENTARYAGLPLPKGVLLVGLPGCGKSLSARALAGDWGVPLLRMDVGRLMGMYVGSSENNLRSAIRTAEAVSPCILWIDEIEKGFSGVQGDGSQGGSGAAIRVFGAFLNWLQDKRSPVFVVATANDISTLPPELLRKGRFDEIFFVGLPEAEERRSIFEIHLQKLGRSPEQFQLDELVAATKAYSGAEIEQVILDGLFRAFHADRDLTAADITTAVNETVPLSHTRAREIASLTQWASQNARMAGTPTAQE